MGQRKPRDLTSRDWTTRHHISKGWTSRDLFQCSSRCSLQVCLIQGVLYELLIGFMFLVLFVSVLLIPYTCRRLSWPALWSTYVRTAPVQSQHVAPRCTLCNSRPRLLPRLPLPIPTPLKLALLAQAHSCSCLHPRCCCCCCCCRLAAVGTPYERRQKLQATVSAAVES